MDRPGLRKLRELVNGRGLAAVIMYDPDRLSRNLGHQLLLAEEFEQGGVKLLIVSHPMQQGPEGWLFFQMRGAVAEYERAKILERTKRGMVARAKAGYVQGSDMPLGYRFVPAGHVHPRDCQATHSRARAGAAGPATDQPKRLGPGVWSASSVHYLLRNEAYVGRWYYNKRRRTASKKQPAKKTM